MPELPEVETVRAGLAPALTNATVKSIDILDVRSLKRHLTGPKDFVKTLVGAKILGVVRRVPSCRPTRRALDRWRAGRF